jgi:hypothetical protein
VNERENEKLEREKKERRRKREKEKKRKGEEGSIQMSVKRRKAVEGGRKEARKDGRR